jgi:pimeloyl-ACP methyl ester carboxylesterase
MNVELLSPIASALGPRRVIAFDMPGVGGSPDPVLPYNAVTMAATASVLLDRLGIERVDVLGISWGGGVAQQFALQHPRPHRQTGARGEQRRDDHGSGLANRAEPARRSPEYTAGKAMQRNLAMLFNGGGSGAPVSLNAARAPSPTGWAYQLAALFGWSSVPLLPWLDVPR